MFTPYGELGINSQELTKALNNQSGGLLPCHTRDFGKPGRTEVAEGGGGWAGRM
jgi:hypothetical protein